MAERPLKVQLSKYEREVRGTIVKSGMTGVAAAALAVSVCSPAGFGDMIGASLASSGVDSTANAADNIYAQLPAFPAPLSSDELSRIQGELASSTAALEITRAATDHKIDRVRELASSDGLVTFTTAREPAPGFAANSALRLTLSAPESFAEAPVEAYVADAQAEELAPVAAAPIPVSYSGPGYSDSVPYRDPHLELADLLLAHESF